MGKPNYSNHVISSTPLAGAAEATEETEFVYYTVRGRRRVRSDASVPELFRQLRVWYGTIREFGDAEVEAAARLAEGRRAPDSRAEAEEPSWDDADSDAGDTMPLLPFPFEDEAAA